jgi:dihydrolipoamide dehydrogenase
LTGGIDLLFKKNQVTPFRGRGVIEGIGIVRVNLSNGEVEKVKAKHIVLATGSRPAPMRGVEEEVVNSKALAYINTIIQNGKVFG